MTLPENTSSTYIPIHVYVVPACSPYAVFRAEDWLPAAASPSINDRPSATQKRRATTPAKAAAGRARWATLVQGDLFQPLPLN